ncbi:hypothetical protein ASE73_15010 [Sphingomonas sp. Leaf24]|uniref:hypothetical protein n=1 Tax=unclassified Sphingomonas TaxID=196159 RepID=UPI0006FB74C4|nr:MULTISPECIES: hypothetical protein [unclassified Sphingomonas]KQM21689.1 hypothetical protein ASE50_13230 [Sphingomonas sp. Leaf5]KQM93792.1 hypothetical protein ASE73_15010 [Sphingomonas sp. Leaf24]
MQHDPQMRAAALAVYEACYPTDDWARLDFDDAERHRTVEYRQSVDAARQVRSVLTVPGEQLAMDALL